MDAKYLFGEDVAATLENYQMDFAAINSFSDLPVDTPERQVMIDKQYAAMQRIADFFVNSSDLFAPYMRFDGTSGVGRWLSKFNRGKGH